MSRMSQANVFLVDTNNDGQADTLVRLWGVADPGGSAISAIFGPNTPSGARAPMTKPARQRALPRGKAHARQGRGEAMLPQQQRDAETAPEGAAVFGTFVPSPEPLRYEAGPSTMQARAHTIYCRDVAEI